jgi:hypothetical protein
VTDIQPYPVKLVWETSKKEDVGEMEVFPRLGEQGSLLRIDVSSGEKVVELARKSELLKLL